MSKNLNKVQLTGNLGKDPETRYTPQGSAITKFSVASSRSWRTAEGEDREDTEWFNVVAWNKLGEICAQYLQKGSRVYIEGRLQTRSWEDQQTGQKRYMTEVIATDMIMLDSRRDRMGDAPSYEEADVGFQEPDMDVDAPARSYQAPRQQQAAPRAASNGNGAANGNGASTRPGPRPAPAATNNAAPRRPVAPPPTDDDDLPF
jgi:single-strand DNA-binding protein